MSLCRFALAGSSRAWSCALLGGYAAASACTSSAHPPSAAAPAALPSAAPLASARPAEPAVPKPETSRPHSKATRLVVGSARSCAILEDRTVACWGSQGNSTPRRIAGLTEVVDVAFARGVVALRSDGTVVVADDGRSPPRTLRSLTGVTRVSGEGTWVHGEGDTVCAIVAEGRVTCYPRGPFDRGTGAENRRVSVRGVYGATELVVGNQNACALVAAGQLRCWSTIEGSPRLPFSAFSIPAIRDATSLSVGTSSVCVRRADGSASCSELTTVPKTSHDLGKVDAMGMAQEGLNAPIACFARGQALECQLLEDLGPPSPPASPAPGPVPASELGKVVQIGMNDLAACALDDQGLVACWGGNRDGRLGRPDVDYVDVPARVPNLPQATQVASGPGFSCALTTHGEVWCWGHEPEYLGNTPRVEQVPGLERVRRIFALGSYACAENVSGEVRCFTGIESTEYKRVSSRVPALDRTRAVAINDESPKRKRVRSRVPALDSTRPAVIQSGPYGWVAAAGGQGELLLGTLPGPNSLDGLTLAPVPELSGIQRVVAYFEYLVALDANGKVFVGRVEKGRLTSKMKHVRALDGAVDMAFGMFLFRGGQIRSWADANPEKTSVYLERSDVVSLPGRAFCGQTAAGDVLGFPISGDKSSAGQVLLRSMKNASGDGELDVCGVDAKGEVFCRGENRLTQCGVRIGFESSATPLTVMLP
jgi:hypothetical protein